MVAITTSCVVLSHRFVGPAFVVRRALQGIMEGRFDERLELRGSDYLQDLAATARELRSFIEARDGQLADVRGLLDDGKVEEARALLGKIVGNDARQPESTEA